MVDMEALEKREALCRRQASEAQNPDVKWLYEDMARYYRKLIARNAFEASAPEPRLVRND